MLKLYRRHIPPDANGNGGCKHASKGTKYNKCSCPIWIDGMHKGIRTRRSLDTFNWEEASKELLRLTTDTSQKQSTIKDAVDDYLKDCEARNLSTGGIKKYRELLNPLKEFCARRAIGSVRALDYATLKEFVRGLGDSSLTEGKKIERLRTFLTHCLNMGWCESNPAAKIKKPKVLDPPVVPITAEEQTAILAAIDKYPTKNSFGYDNRKRMLAFVLTLRYTALRISDAVTLRVDKINNGRLMLRTSKAGVAVHLKLPPVLIDALKAIQRDGCQYFFWTGKGNVKSVKDDWYRSFSRLVKLAKVKAHPHQYRHTMACDLLSKGVTVDAVAAILGNTPAIVLKHYAPWVKSRQDALDAAVQLVWETSA